MSLIVSRVESDPVALRLILRGLVRVKERFVDLALRRVVLHALLLILLPARINRSAVGSRFRLFGCGCSVRSFLTVLQVNPMLFSARCLFCNEVNDWITATVKFI